MSGKKIAYVELPAADPAMVITLKVFYGRALGWDFQDWGESYAAFSAGLDGGINADTSHRTASPLVIVKVEDLAATLEEVTLAGAVISRPPFEFPGGRRFHFIDPAGNELAAVQYDPADAA